MKKHLIPAIGAALTIGVGGAMVSASSEPTIPPIDQIGAQYVTETGATSVACSQIPELIICYGLLDGAVIAGVWADGVFTPHVDPSAAAAAPTTTTAAVVAASASGNVGVVWTGGTPNTTLEQPVFEVDGITSRVDAIVVVDPTLAGDLSMGCQDEIDFMVEYMDAEPASQCVYVSWSFDVSPDFQDEEGRLSPGSMLTPEGLQIDQAITASGLPGSQGRTIEAFYAGGTPGSTLTFDTGSNSVGWTQQTVEVPALADLAPVN